MGTFKKLGDNGEARRRSNHKRAITVSAIIHTDDVDTVAARVAETPHGVNWQGEEVARVDELALVRLRYGPVYGAFVSDVRRFLEKAGVVFLAVGSEPDEVEHSPDCEHDSHKKSG